MPTRVLFCLPDRDFDVTEVATPWHRLREAGFRVVFATQAGDVAQADPLLLRGVLFGKLGAQPDALERYHRMVQSPEFLKPLTWSQVAGADMAALVLPGGHAQGMKPYLESPTVQDIARAFLHAAKPVGAICHGVIVLARTLDPSTGKSLLAERKVTGLLKSLERTAYWATAWKLGRYYRTYPAYVQDEITAALAHPRQFLSGRAAWVPFVVRDGNLITARWPKDAELFVAELIHALAEREQTESQVRAPAAPARAASPGSATAAAGPQGAA